jgi:hypothetical protein
MIIIKEKVDLSRFIQLEKTDIQNNKKKIFIKGDLIIENDLVNNGEIALTGNIIFNGGKLINNGKIFLINKQSLIFTIKYDLKNKNNLSTGIFIDNYKNEKIRIIILEPENSTFYFRKIITDNQQFSINGGELFLNIKDIGINIYKNYRLVIEFI